MSRGDGRALRFVGLIAGGWIVVRAAVLWQSGGPPEGAVRGATPTRPSPTAVAGASPLSPAPRQASRSSRPVPRISAVSSAKPPRTFDAEAPLPEFGGPRVAFIAPGFVDRPITVAAASPGFVAPQTAIAGALTPLPPQAPLGSGTRRLSVSGWLIVRSGVSGGDGGALAPQLGGTQGGARIDYRIAHGFAATARAAAPAAGAGRELSLGIAWRPRSVPVRIVVEQRLALDGARGGPAIGISGGVDALPLPAGFDLESYGQAGTIFRTRPDHFVDGSARATRPVGTLGAVDLDAGGGVWGGAQRGVARVDIGPTIGARVPIAGKRLRIALDWRQRIAGDARPGSGPALTLGTDF